MLLKCVTVLLVFKWNVQAFDEKFNVLTKNLFENLQADPRLLDDYEVGPESQNFISRQIENYIHLVTREEPVSSKNKRSLNSEEFIEHLSATTILEKIYPVNTLPVRFPQDIAFFNQENNWYAAALTKTDYKSSANNLTIYQYRNNSFQPIVNTTIYNNGRKIITLPLDSKTLILVSQYGNNSINQGVFEFSTNNLSIIQHLDLHQSSAVNFWQYHEEIFLAIGHFNETQLLIYKWFGEHFDIVQKIAVRGPIVLTPFQLNHHHFIAIANSKKLNETQIYAELFRYDVHKENYQLHQRIATKNCRDIKFFSGQNNYFLAIANYFEEINNTIEYETDSILYKFVDDYFIPFQSFRLNGIEEWLPIQQHNGSLILFAVTAYEGVRIFQNDGWSFVEITHNFPNIFGKDVKSLRYYNMNNTHSLLVVNQQNMELTPNLYELKFIRDDTLEKFRQDMMDWCFASLDGIQEIDKDQILGKPQRSDIEANDLMINDKILDLQNEIDEISMELRELEKESKTTLQALTPKTINRPIVADQIIFNNDIFIKNLTVSQLNNISVDDFLDNVINITEDFHLDDLEIESLILNQSTLPLKINGKSSSNLVAKNHNLTIGELIINGSISCNNIQVGKLNGVNVTDKTILLINKEQNITEPVRITTSQFNNITFNNINNISVSNMKINEKRPKISEIHNLTVDHLVINQYINDVELETIDKFALKIEGDQIISHLYKFHELHGDNFRVDGLISNKNLSRLIRIDEGNFTFENKILFTNLTVNNLEITEWLNGISVDKNGKLDILYNNYPETQHVTGRKYFNDLEITNPIQLQTRIISESLKKINPVKTTDLNLTLEGDYMIDNEVTIEDFFSFEDILIPSGTRSLKRLQESGLQLDATEIRPILRFDQQLNVETLFADRINGIDPENFVISDDRIQNIDGWKIFTGDVTVTGATESFIVNDINVELLETNVLMINGDQEITGKLHMQHVETETISSKTTKFGNNYWNETMTITTNQDVEEIKKINGDLLINGITVNKIEVDGLINGRNFSQIIADTVTKSTNTTITGHKTFRNLTVDYLTVKDGPSIVRLENIFDEPKNELYLEGPINFNKPITIENITFRGNFNDVPAHEFGQFKMNENNILMVDGDWNFTEFRISGQSFIRSGEINHVNIEELVENSVKIDEDFQFDSATFDTIMLEKPVLLEGEIEKVDFENIFLPDADMEQTISDEIIFESQVIVNGSITIDGKVNGINLTQFCDFANGNAPEPKNLLVDGNAFFVKGPDVNRINGLEVANIWDRAWFKNRPASITGYAHFGNITFLEDINVGNFVDNISLKWISENYFSKSRDQIVPATLSFDDIICEKNLSVPEVISDTGIINGINIDEFVSTTLLNDFSQTFESGVYLENCYIKDLKGDFLVNDLDLDSDIMRADKYNLVTGLKHIERLEVEHLQIDRHLKIQNIDVDWFYKIVLRDGDYHIHGNKAMRNLSALQGLSLRGKLNGLQIDAENVMLRDVPQNITGRKLFISDPRYPTTFKQLKLKNRLNHIDLNDLIQNQAYKNIENTIKTPINFHNNITMDRLITKNNFQNLNITDLIHNVTTFKVIDNLEESYTKLLNVVNLLDQSFKRQAYFLRHYKLVQTIPGKDHFIAKFGDGNYLAAVNTTYNVTEFKLYEWNSKLEEFIEYKTYSYSSSQIRYLDQTLMGRYLYLEEDSEYRYLRFSNSLSIDRRGPTNETKATTSFYLPTEAKEPCTLFIYKNGSPPTILCELQNDISMIQELPEVTACKATSIMIKDILYLIITNQESNNMDSNISTWIFNPSMNRFEPRQIMYETQPMSISAISYHNRTFLAIVSGRVKNTLYFGKIIIKQFDRRSNKFIDYQHLELNSPKQVEFSLLPTNELVLYIITDNVVQPLLVYRYNGLAGFQEIVKGSSLQRISYINQFLGGDQDHFVVLQNNDEINIIRAFFKGRKIK